MAPAMPTPGLISIEYPQGTLKRDAPSIGGTPRQQISDDTQAILNGCINGTIPINPGQDLVSFSQDDSSCYRNVILTVLMHMKPILSLVYKATDGDAIDPPDSIIILRKIAEAYWNPFQSRLERSSTIDPLVQQWFTLLEQNTAYNVESWATRRSVAGQADAVEFLSYWLDRARDGELKGDGQAVLDRLCKTQMVSRFAYQCNCPNKKRQPFSDNDIDLWCVSVNADSRKTSLAQLLSQQVLYNDRSGFMGTCPMCNAAAVQIHQYNKFRYLPEIIFVGITRVKTRDGTLIQPMQTDPSADTDMPHQIDLSQVEDHSTNDNYPSQDPDPSIYELRAVVAYRTDEQGRSGHYYVLVRRPDDSWTAIDERATEPVRVCTSLQLRSQFQARMLAYVKVRPLRVDFNPPNSTANVSQVVGSQSLTSPLYNDSATMMNGNISDGLGSLFSSPRTSPRTRPEQIKPFADSSLPQAPQRVVTSPTTIQPTSTQPTSTQPTSTQPTSTQPTTTQPTTTQPTTTQATTTQAQPTLPSASPVLPDATGWDSHKLRQELNARHITFPGNLQNQGRLMTIWNNYRIANHNDRLSMLKNDELVRRATAAGISDVSASSTKQQLVQALIRHGNTQPARRPTAPTPIGTVPTPNQSLDSTARFLDINTRLQNENTRLTQQLQQAYKQLNHANAALATAQSQVANLIQQSLGGIISQSRIWGTSQGCAQTQPPMTQEERLYRQQQKPTPRGNSLPPDLTSIQRSGPLPPATAGRALLRVTTRQVIDGQGTGSWNPHWGDHQRYLEIPYYRADQYLNTIQWTRTMQYRRNNVQPPGEIYVAIEVYVGFQDQSGAPSTLYRYRIAVGPSSRCANLPTPRVDVELLQPNTIQDLPSDLNRGVEIIRASTQPTPDRQTQNNNVGLGPVNASVTFNTPRDQTDGANGTDNRLSTVRKDFTNRSPTLSVGNNDNHEAYLTVTVDVNAQQIGHSAIQKSFQISLSNYNPGETIRSSSYVQVTAAGGQHPSIGGYYSSPIVDTSSTMLFSRFLPLIAAPSVSSSQVNSGSRRPRSDSNDNGDRGNRPKRQRTSGTNRTQGDSDNNYNNSQHRDGGKDHGEGEGEGAIDTHGEGHRDAEGNGEGGNQANIHVGGRDRGQDAGDTHGEGQDEGNVNSGENGNTNSHANGDENGNDHSHSADRTASSKPRSSNTRSESLPDYQTPSDQSPPELFDHEARKRQNRLLDEQLDELWHQRGLGIRMINGVSVVAPWPPISNTPGSIMHNGIAANGIIANGIATTTTRSGDAFSGSMMNNLTLPDQQFHDFARHPGDHHNVRVDDNDRDRDLFGDADGDIDIDIDIDANINIDAITRHAANVDTDAVVDVDANIDADAVIHNDTHTNANHDMDINVDSNIDVDTNMNGLTNGQTRVPPLPQTVLEHQGRHHVNTDDRDQFDDDVDWGDTTLDE